MAARKPERKLSYTPLSEIERKSIVFVDPPLWQASAFHLVVGRKGVGKGTAFADLAARVTRGELGEKRNVIWITSEDSAAIDIGPRVDAAGGEDSRIFIVNDWLQLPRDIDNGSLANTVEDVGDTGLLIIDPVGNHITGKNSNAETDIRDAIGPLNAFADEYGLIVAGVRHLTEKDASAGALASILGSSAWVQVPRVVIGIAKDNEDPAISHMQCIAGNRMPPDTPGRAFRIEGVDVGLENEVTRAVWLGDSRKDVENLIAAGARSSKSREARELILELLEGVDRMDADELDKQVVDQTGLTLQAVRNQRSKLAKEGSVASEPVRDETGAVIKWTVRRVHVENFSVRVLRPGRVSSKALDTQRGGARRATRSK